MSKKETIREVYERQLKAEHEQVHALQHDNALLREQLVIARDSNEYKSRIKNFRNLAVNFLHSLDKLNELQKCSTAWSVNPKGSPHEIIMAANDYREARAKLEAFIQRGDVPETAHKCAGVPDRNCQYLAPCGSPCNKCGKVHNVMSIPVPTPAMPAAWREVMAELVDDVQAACDAKHPHREQYPFIMRRYNNDMEIVEKARTLLKFAEVQS